MKFFTLALLFLALFAFVTRADDGGGQPQQSSDAQPPPSDGSQSKQSDISKFFQKSEDAIKSVWQKMTGKKSSSDSAPVSTASATTSSASVTTSIASSTTETSSVQGSQ